MHIFASMSDLIFETKSNPAVGWDPPFRNTDTDKHAKFNQILVSGLWNKLFELTKKTTPTTR